MVKDMQKYAEVCRSTNIDTLVYYKKYRYKDISDILPKYEDSTKYVNITSDRTSDIR
jgi:hypothetical protein